MERLLDSRKPDSSPAIGHSCVAARWQKALEDGGRRADYPPAAVRRRRWVITVWSRTDGVSCVRGVLRCASLLALKPADTGADKQRRAYPRLRSFCGHHHQEAAPAWPKLLSHLAKVAHFRQLRLFFELAYADDARHRHEQKSICCSAARISITVAELW